jgi:tetratricopeptide (TPR) repeat protein/transcriptional regulator with XRE-family HTH domain
MENQWTFPGGFGELLKTFRKRQRLTQKHLAQQLGVHSNTVSSWELGSFLPATRGLVLELARHLALNELETRQLLETSLTALSPHWHIPFPRNPLFTGREEILKTLHTQLDADQAVALIQSSALHGLGGVGKTQIALEYAYRYALEYSAIFWIGAETMENVTSSLLHMAEVLQLPERDEKDQQRVIAAVYHWLTTHNQWLLIWDNLEDLKLLHRFLPPARQGAILITTRNPALGTLAVGMDLLPMGLEEGMLLVLRRAKVLERAATRGQLRQFARYSPTDYAAAEELVTVMGGLPLALDQAGAYIEETGCSLAAYLQRYRQQQAHLLARRGTPGGNHPESVTTTFRLSQERVEREQRAAADLLRVCALLQAEAIPEELFVIGAPHLGPELEALAADPAQFDQTIAVVRRLSLVQRQAETQTLSVHRLVQAVLREQMSEPEQATWLRRVMAALNAAFSEGAYEAWERFLPHVLTVVSAIPDDAGSRELAQVLRKVAEYLCHHARYAQAEALYQRAVRIAEQVWGPEHFEIASTLCGLACLFYEQGKYQQVEALYQRAVQIQEQVLGLAHPDVAFPLHGLGLLYWKEGKYEQAERMYQRALQIREQARGEEHPDLAPTLNGLAILSHERGQYEQAEHLYQRALHLREQVLEPEHPLLANLLNNLAEAYVAQGKESQAECLYQRALAIDEQAYGPDHPSLAHPLQGLADLYVAQAKDAQAEPLYQRALFIREQALGTEHPDLASSLNGLAHLSLRQGEYDQAELLYKRALSIQEQHLGQHHPETAQTLHNLATCQQKQGRLSEALSLAECALSIRSQSLGDAHPKTVATRTLSTQLGHEQEWKTQGKSPGHRAEECADRVGNGGALAGALLLSQATAHPPVSDEDPLRGFLAACCELHPRAWCRSADLWMVYERWVQEHQERFPLSRRAFTTQLKAHGCHADRTETARIWRGITITPEADGT